MTNEANRQAAQDLMRRVEELEDQWVSGLHEFEDVNSTLKEARSLLESSDPAQGVAPWEMKLARLTTRLATLDHAVQVIFHQLHVIQQVDPLFEPAPENAEQ